MFPRVYSIKRLLEKYRNINIQQGLMRNLHYFIKVRVSGLSAGYLPAKKLLQWIRVTVWLTIKAQLISVLKQYCCLFKVVVGSPGKQAQQTGFYDLPTQYKNNRALKRPNQNQEFKFHIFLISSFKASHPVLNFVGSLRRLS